MGNLAFSQLRTRSARIMGAVGLCLCFGAGGSGAGEEPAPPLSDLEAIGMVVERSALDPVAEREAALSRAGGSLKTLLKSGLDREQKKAGIFLSGEIAYARAEYENAWKAFRKAEKEYRKTPLAADALLAAIAALEAQGKDEEAANEWEKWEKNYAQHPLLPEARLARTWNTLRRGDLARASRLMDLLVSEAPWMADDPRVILARATGAYLDDRIPDAVALLENGRGGAAETYLLALCYAAQGDVLKAAARYQDVAERFPDSSLRDAAMLAKADTFLGGNAYRSAADEFARVTQLARNPEVIAEATLRHAASMTLAGETALGSELLREVTAEYKGTHVAARAQFILGEVLFVDGRYQEAIVEFNQVLTEYFEHELAATAQYRVGRSLDALDRPADATSTYQAVVSGYPQTSEAPAAAYLAGVGLLGQNRPLIAAPYFQLVLDRYAQDDSTGMFVFADPEHQELTEASLCLLELSYHRAGDLGQLSGMPHVMLQKMPPSSSPWRAYALLIDADALAAQARYPESQEMLERLTTEFPEHEVAVHANRLLAWTYARQGHDDLAIQTEERMLARYAATGNSEHLASAYLNKAHVLFNKKSYSQAADAYEDFLNRFPGHEDHLLALYQGGLCYLRLDRSGDAVDRWEALVSLAPDHEMAERAWMRVGDLYFQAEHYEDAKRCYQGLLEHFGQSAAASMGLLRLAQCDYNAGRDAEALASYSEIVARYPGTQAAEEAERGMELALYRLGQNEDGAAILAELVERYPTSAFAADAQFQVARRLYDDKAYVEAANEFRRVVSQFPGFSAADRAYFLMGDAYAQAGSSDDARLAYEQFLLFFAQSELRPTVRFRLGALRFEGEDYMRAAVDFTSVLETEVSQEVASASLFNLALCQRMLGSSEEARSSLERYRAEYGTDERAAEIAYQLSDIHDQAGRPELARTELEKALSAGVPEGRAVELRYRLGLSREQEGDVDGALAAYGQAVSSSNKADPFRLSAVARAAALYEQKGDFDRALSAYRDLIQNAQDPELVAAAAERATQLSGANE